MHSKNHKSKTSIISFSSQVFSDKTLEKSNSSTASPNNIFTWMQLRGDESAQNVLPVVNDVCQEIIDVIKRIPNIGITYNEKNYIIYDMHDGKMLYLLTQHSLYSRKYKPFVLCKCSRGEGVQKRDHECKLLDDWEHQHYYDRSQRKFDRKVSKNDGNLYTKKYHMKWVDTDNEGCSHFGISPLLLRR